MFGLEFLIAILIMGKAEKRKAEAIRRVQKAAKKRS